MGKYNYSMLDILQMNQAGRSLDTFTQEGRDNVVAIANEAIFGDTLTVLTEAYRNMFALSFMSRYLTNEIGMETLYLFRVQLALDIAHNATFINSLMDNLDRGIFAEYTLATTDTTSDTKAVGATTEEALDVNDTESAVITSDVTDTTLATTDNAVAVEAGTSLDTTDMSTITHVDGTTEGGQTGAAWAADLPNAPVSLTEEYASSANKSAGTSDSHTVTNDTASTDGTVAGKVDRTTTTDGEGSQIGKVTGAGNTTNTATVTGTRTGEGTSTQDTNLVALTESETRRVTLEALMQAQPIMDRVLGLFSDNFLKIY